MSKLWDELADSAETQEEWLLRDNKVATEALKGKSIPLPEPYKRRTGQLESDTLKAVREVLETVTALWFRRIEGAGKLIHTGSQEMLLVKSNMTGMPDFIAIWRQLCLGIEVKAPGGHLAAEQKACLDGMTLAGGVGMVVCDPEKLRTWFESGDGATKWGKLLLM